jgi:hypothetical protein
MEVLTYHCAQRTLIFVKKVLFIILVSLKSGNVVCDFHNIASVFQVPFVLRERLLD